MKKIKKNDQVIVIAGRDKGKQGEVTAVVGTRYVVSGINMIKKHRKPNPQRGIEGGIVEQEAPIQASNVAIYNPDSGKADRVGFEFIEGEKVRVYKSSRKPVED